MSNAIDPTKLFALQPGEEAAFEKAPSNLLAVNQQIDYMFSLPDDDDRFVVTLKARGDKFRNKFFRALGYEEQTGNFDPPKKQHLLFIGHVGCGKSTELARLTAQIHKPNLYWVARADITTLLDPNDLKYFEVWLAIAQQVIASVLSHNEKHPAARIDVPEAEYGQLRDWLTTHVTQHETLKELTGSLETSAQLGGSLPFIGKLLAKVTGSVKAGSTYRDIVRNELNKGFSEFIQALNTFLASVAAAIDRAGQGKSLLLVIDGLDRLKGDDWHNFFINDVNQLISVDANVVYTAPMALKASGLMPSLFVPIVMPMIKLRNFDDGTPFTPGYEALRRLVLLRANYRLFQSLAELDTLIESSGGHLRGLLQLLYYACIEADDGIIDAETVARAIKSLAGDFRDWLKTEHYQVLAQVDQDPDNTGRSELMTALIDRGALLEYNEGSWRQSHPVIRTLIGYDRARQAAAQP